MTKGAYVKLNEMEQRLVKTVAKGRRDFNTLRGTKRVKYPDVSDEYLPDIEGFAGEVAFCKIFNIFPDMDIRPVTHETDDGDCLWNGLRIDVKTTHRPEGKLLCSNNKKLGMVDYYALMTGVFPMYFYRGVISAEELLVSERMTTLMPVPAYVADQEELYELTNPQLEKR
jgi:hypothetical protein